MAAKPPHVLLIDCPPPSNDGGGWRQQRRVWTNAAAAACKKACTVTAFVLLCAFVVTFFVLLFVFSTHQLPSWDPVYSVAITGVTGLDALTPPSSPSPSSAADHDHDHDRYYTPAATPLSPVFNLTFQIDTTRGNNSDHDDACIPGLSTAEVSYGDAYLAGGSVPPFCARENRTSVRVAAVAWCDGVAVPKFLRNRLAAELAAGDASVDVKVTMPTYCMKAWCGGAVLSCKPKIGGGPSPPYRLDFL